MAKIDPKVLKGERLGRILRRMGRCTREQVYEALHLQKERKEQLGVLLIELGHCTELQITEALSLQRGFQMVNLEGRTIDPDALAAIPPETARAYSVVPLKYDESSRRILIAMKSPDNFRAIDDLSQLMDFKVQAVVADPAQVDALIKEHFSGATDLGQVLARAEDSDSLGSLSSSVSSSCMARCSCLIQYSVVRMSRSTASSLQGAMAARSSKLAATSAGGGRSSGSETSAAASRRVAADAELLVAPAGWTAADGALERCVVVAAAASRPLAVRRRAFSTRAETTARNAADVRDLLRTRLSLTDAELDKVERHQPVGARATVEPKLQWLQARLDLDAAQLGKMVLRLPPLLSKSVESMDSRLDWLQRRLGLSPPRNRDRTPCPGPVTTTAAHLYGFLASSSLC